MAEQKKIFSIFVLIFFEKIAFVFMVIACVCAKPKPDVIAYSAPLVAAPLTTSSAIVSSELQSQFIQFYIRIFSRFRM